MSARLLFSRLATDPTRSRRVERFGRRKKGRKDLPGSPRSGVFRWFWKDLWGEESDPQVVGESQYLEMEEVDSQNGAPQGRRRSSTLNSRPDLLRPKARTARHGMCCPSREPSGKKQHSPDFTRRARNPEFTNPEGLGLERDFHPGTPGKSRTSPPDAPPSTAGPARNRRPRRPVRTKVLEIATASGKTGRVVGRPVGCSPCG